MCNFFENDINVQLNQILKLTEYYDSKNYLNILFNVFIHKKWLKIRDLQSIFSLLTSCLKAKYLKAINKSHLNLID